MTAEDNRPLSREDVDALTAATDRAFGLPETFGGAAVFARRFVNFSFKDAKKYARASQGLIVLLGIYPLIIGQVLAMVDEQKKLVVFLFLAVPLIVLLVVNLYMPRDFEAHGLFARLVKTRMAVHRLAGQLALQRFARAGTPHDIQPTIDQVNRLIDQPACAALEKNRLAVSALLTGPSEDWSKSFIKIEELGLSPELRAELSAIAQSVATACEDLFNQSRYTVKIYVRTVHQFEFQLGVKREPEKRSVEMLTAIARFPARRGNSSDYQGKSWIDCKGKRADVWTCQDNRQVIVFKSVSGADSKVYPSIACLPLPQQLGVITIESADPTSFDRGADADSARTLAIGLRDDRPALLEHTVSNEMSESIVHSVKDRIVAALLAEELRGGERLAVVVA